MSRGIRVSVVEVLFKVKIVISLLQELGTIIGVNIISIFPSIMFFIEPFPLNLKLELISEPLSIQILLNNPEVFIIYLHRRQGHFLTSGDHVRFHFRKNIDMEDVVNPPS